MLVCQWPRVKLNLRRTGAAVADVAKLREYIFPKIAGLLEKSAMSQPNGRLDAVLTSIDEANSRDPKLEDADGGQQPAALLYGQRMSGILDTFAPDASDHLKIAVRGQHIERWTRPRSDYPDGRSGYLQWRRDAAKFHADRVSDLMREQGYQPDDLNRAAMLIRKQAIKTDTEAQILEDVACLVFMRWYVASFAAKRSPDDLFAIVEKTARKMSAAGRREALKLPLPGELVPAIMAAEQPST
jgi:hypothetical protein